MINLPKRDSEGKQYLSYSQVSCFLKNKKDFIRQYFYKEPIAFKDYLLFGTKIGQALETNDFSGFTEKEQKTLSSIKRLDIFEKEIRLDFGEFYLKGFIDTIDKDFKHAIDYKTAGGESKIEEYKKKDYIQLLLYALGIEQETGKLPETISVILIDRKGNAYQRESLTLGEQVWEIPLELTEERLQYAKDRVIEVANQISRLYSVFLKLNK